jgi:uncharacterized membrane protein
MFVAVFGEESKATEASRYLTELQVGQDNIAHAVLKKDEDSRIFVVESYNAYQEVRETAISAMIDLLVNGPSMGNAQRAAAIALAAIDAEFLKDLSQEFTPGRFALVSDVRKDHMYRVDQRVDALGGKVFRTP